MSSGMMTGLLNAVLTVLLALGCSLCTFQGSFVRCKLQHDPGGPSIFQLHDARAAIGQYFTFSLPSLASHSANESCKLAYKISEVGDSALPMWLIYNESSQTLHGVPLLTDEGFYLIRVAVVSSHQNMSDVVAQDVFAIDVHLDTKAVKELTRSDILSGKAVQAPQAISRVQLLSDHIKCKQNEIKTRMSVIFDVDVKTLCGKSRVNLLTKLSNVVSVPPNEFHMSVTYRDAVSQLPVGIVIAAGPGNTHNSATALGSKGVILSWPLPCASWTLVNHFPNVMIRNIASGHLKNATSYDIISWCITKVDVPETKVGRRAKRAAGMTSVSTPVPTQTASSLTATTILSSSLPASQTESTISPSSPFTVDASSTLPSGSISSLPSIATGVFSTSSSLMASTSVFLQSTILESSSFVTSLISDSGSTYVTSSNLLTSSQAPPSGVSIMSSFIITQTSHGLSSGSTFSPQQTATSLTVTTDSSAELTSVNTGSIVEQSTFLSTDLSLFPSSTHFTDSSDILSTDVPFETSSLSTLQSSPFPTTLATYSLETSTALYSSSIFVTHTLSQQPGTSISSSPTDLVSDSMVSSTHIFTTQPLLSGSTLMISSYSTLGSETLFPSSSVDVTSSVLPASTMISEVSSAIQATTTLISEGTSLSFRSSSGFSTIASSIPMQSTEVASSTDISGTYSEVTSIISFSESSLRTMRTSTEVLSSETAIQVSTGLSSLEFSTQVSPSNIVTASSFIRTSLEGSMTQIMSSESALISSQVESSLPSMSSVSSSVAQTQTLTSFVSLRSSVERSSDLSMTLTSLLQSSEMLSSEYESTSVIASTYLPLTESVSSLVSSSSNFVTMSSKLSSSVISTSEMETLQPTSFMSLMTPSPSGRVTTDILSPGTPNYSSSSVLTSGGELLSSDTIITSNPLTDFMTPSVTTVVTAHSTIFPTVSTGTGIMLSTSSQSSEISGDSVAGSTLSGLSSLFPSPSESAQPSSLVSSPFKSDSSMVETFTFSLQTTAPSPGTTAIPSTVSSSHQTLSSDIYSEFSEVPSYSSSVFSTLSMPSLSPSTSDVFSTSTLDVLSSSQSLSSSSDEVSSRMMTNTMESFSSPGYSVFSSLFTGVQSEMMTSSSGEISTASLQSSSSDGVLSSTIQMTHTIATSSLLLTDTGSLSVPSSSMTGQSSMTSVSLSESGSLTSSADTMYVSTSVQTPSSSLSYQMSTIQTITPSTSFGITPSSASSTPLPGSSIVMSSELYTSTSQQTTSQTSPISSSVMQSSSVLEPSSTIAVESTSSSQLLTSVIEPTPSLSALPSSEIVMSSSQQASLSSHIVPTSTFTSQTAVVSSSVTPTAEPTTQPPLTTSEPVNQRPSLQYPIDEIVTVLGDVLHFIIPENTFLDPEEGSTSNLQLSLRMTDNQPVLPSFWLQLDASQQALIGVPLDANLTVVRNEFLLSATDSEGLVAYDAFVVAVEKRPTDFSHEFVITMENNFHNFISESRNIVQLSKEISDFLNDPNTNALSISSVEEGSVIMAYANKTISRSVCDIDTINTVLRSFAYSNNTPILAFHESLLPNYEVTNVEVVLLNICAPTTLSPITNTTQALDEGPNYVALIVVPITIVALLFLLCVIICCCYKRKRGGDEFLLREEKPIYAKNRKPIYLDGELDDKGLLGASNPVVLPLDVELLKSSRPAAHIQRGSPATRKQPPSPPQYRLPDYARLDLELNELDRGVLPGVDPPVYSSQPSLAPPGDPHPLSGRHPPLYRLPPPYQSQEMGFFDESNI